jgi:simple sugar transport system permease protein
MEQSMTKQNFDMGRWSVYSLYLAAFVAIVAFFSFIVFLSEIEELSNSVMMWVSIALVGIGMAGVVGGIYLKNKGDSRALVVSLLGNIVILIGMVLSAIVIEEPALQSGWWVVWWLAFYCVIAAEVVIGFGMFLHGRKNSQYEVVGFARKNALQIGLLIVFELMWIVYITQAPGTFLAPEMYGAFMSTIPFFGIIALPLTMVIIAGEIDLSFPSIMALGTVTFLEVFDLIMRVAADSGMTESSEGTIIAIAATIAFVACLFAGFIAGLMNGLLVVKIGIPSLIATIGTQFFWRGLILVIREGRSGVLVDPKHSYLGQILVGKVGGYLPMQMLWLIVIAVLTWMLLNRHKFGAHIYLIGDNENSARLMGVNSDRTRILIFALVGTVSALAGIIASLHVVNFFTSQGEGYLMTTLASVFLGGTSVFGGTGTILGTFVACFMIGSIEAGIVAIGMTGFWTKLIYGLTIVISVAMHAILRKRMG